MKNISLHPKLKWRHFEHLDSTNAFLLDNHQPYNQLISTEHQSAGRGRRQQQWIDEHDSLLMSLSTNFDYGQDLGAWAIQVAITLAKALEPLTSQPLKIKWPNDLYTLNDQAQWGKFTGILVESIIGQSGKMVTGVGINLANLKTDIATDYPTAYLQTSLDKMELIPYLGSVLFEAWEVFLHAPYPCPDTYQRYDFLQGKKLQATDPFNEITHIGIGAGINTKGQLQLNCQNTQHVLTSQQRIRILE